MAKKTPAKAGDVTIIVGGVRALINHIQAKAWMDALGDIKAIGLELYHGFAVPSLTLATLDLSAGDDCGKLCDDLEACCCKVEDCGGDMEKIAKLCPATATGDPATAIGPWISLFAPMLLQALQAIINGLMKEKQAA